MFRKILFFTLFVLLHSNFFTIYAQQNPAGSEIAALKYKLTDFRNPSMLRYRFGLLLFSSDGKFLATSGTARDIKIYDTATGEIKATLDGDRNGFNAFSFDPDDKTVIAQDSDYSELRVFEVGTGKLLKTIDGSRATSAGKKNMANSLRGLGGLEMSPAPVTADWKTALIQKNEGEYEIVDLETNDVRYKFEHSKKSNPLWDFFKSTFIPIAGVLISNANFSPDGKLVAIANGNNEPTLWSAETGKLVAKLVPQNDRVYNAGFSPDGKLVTTTDINGVTNLWETETGKMLASFGSKKDKTHPAAWSADGRRLVTISFKKDARVWDARDGNLLFALKASDAATVVFSPNGELLATTSQSNKTKLAQIWKAENGELVAALPRIKDEDRAFSLVWSPDGKLLITASSDRVKIWNAKGELLQTLEDAVFPARFSRDGKLLATGGKNDVGYVWQIREN